MQGPLNVKIISFLNIFFRNRFSRKAIKNTDWCFELLSNFLKMTEETP